MSPTIIAAAKLARETNQIVAIVYSLTADKWILSCDPIYTSNEYYTRVLPDGTTERARTPGAIL